MSPERATFLKKRIDRADRWMKLTGIGALLCILSLLVLIVAQEFATQQQLTDAITNLKATGTSNHKKTQQYVKCIGEEVLKPFAQRTQADLDSCGIYGTPVENS